METTAVVLKGPNALSLEAVPLVCKDHEEVVIDVLYSGISTGTEKLLWSGDMPPFPGMGYPLVPGYEALGEVVEAPANSGLHAGDRVFVPGASCFGEVRGLFGAAAARVSTRPERIARLDRATGPEGALLALAATARHALSARGAELPELIVGHGVLGRLLARMTILMGGAPPMVWETDPRRRLGDHPYPILDVETDSRRDYSVICDVTGDSSILDSLIGRLSKGGEIVLAGFYPSRINFAFPMAFMKEARLRIAAEWTPEDMTAVVDWLDKGVLRLDDLITHTSPAQNAVHAYHTAFTDSACLKMILDWKGSA